MSLDLLKSALVRADFKPHTLAVGTSIGELRGLASARAQAVLNRAWEERITPTLGDVLSGDPWPREVRTAYEALGDSERMEVLGVAGFYAHELIHKIDLLTTPFGVGFHGRAFLETLGLQHDAHHILSELEASPENRPLRDYPRLSDTIRAREGPAALLARVRWFDSLRGAPARFIERGWGGVTNPVILLRHRLAAVEVHAQMQSVALPDDNGYLRPLTILESRALAASLLNLFARLGSGEFAAAEVARFVRTYYEPRRDYSDYRFLLDLYASLGGAADFPSVIESADPTVVAGALTWVVMLGWYALHAPPWMEGDGNAFANSSSITRLMVVIQELEEAIVEGREYPYGVAFLNEVDASDRAAKLNIRPCAEVLKYCVKYVHTLRLMNAGENGQPVLAEHFDQIFDIQEQQLKRRVDRGFTSMLGMPDGGDIVGGFEDLEVDRYLLLESYEPPAEVQRWFRLREDLLFRYARPPGFWAEIRAFLRAADASNADAARRYRQNADARAAFGTALLLYEQEDMAGAEAAFKSASELGITEATYDYGLLLLRRGNRRAAEAAFARADEDGMAEAAYNLGVLLRDRDELGQAEAAFARADKRGHPMAARNLGLLLRDRNDRQGAKRALLRADERGDPEAGCTLGVLLLEEDKVDEAEGAFSRADERGSADGAYNLGVLLLEDNRTDEAEAAFMRADERGSAGGAYNLGVLRIEENRVDEAEEAFARADERGSADGAYNLGILLLSRRRDEAGFEAIVRADQRGSAEGAFELGRLRLLQGRTQEAKAAFLRAVERGGAAGGS